MQNQTDKDKIDIIQEFEYLISDFIRGERNDDTFFELTATWQLYLSENYLRKLVDNGDLFKVDEYLSCFITFVFYFFI